MTVGACCCALAGTAACRYCSNNPYAEPSPYRYSTIISTGDSTSGTTAPPSRPTPKPEPERVEVDLCVTCKFFKEPDGEPVFPVAQRIGECRRNPPTGDRQWPKVGGADECGEWKRRR